MVLALFTSFYHLLPAKRPDLPLALVGGVVAASLWELVRRLLVFYFANVSVVGAVYGSLASIIVLLSTFEAGALVLLLGAQVVAEIQRSLASGLAWHADPDKHA